MFLNGNCCCPAHKWIRRSAFGLTAGLALGLLFISGCSKAPIRRTAKKEIRSANTAISHAESCALNKDYGYAIASLNEASGYVSTGKKYATGRQKTSLSSLSNKISRMLAEYDLKKKKQDAEKAEAKAKKAEEEALAKANKEKAKGQKVAKNEPGEPLDPAELARQLAAKKKAKKVKAGTEDLDAAMKATDKPKEATEEPRPSMDQVAGGGKEGGGEAKKEEPKDEGPYRAYGADRPSLSIDKVMAIGNHALVYLQVYNKDPQNNKRIGRVEVVFKDAGNGKLFDTRYVYVYEKFSTKKKDLFDQDDPMAALTGGSHEVFAGKTLKLVAVGESQVYAKKAAKAAVTVHYEDGSSDSDTGPGSLIDPVKKKAAIPGL